MKIVRSATEEEVLAMIELRVWVDGARKKIIRYRWRVRS
jgi:hypothetical protein